MQMHRLQRHTSSRRARRIGRGGKRGTYSGRGIKGQRARAGAKFRPAEREILKRIPKLRGYRFKSFQIRPVAVPFHRIEKKFSSGSEISPQSLFDAGLVRHVKGRLPRVKIVGKGESKASFTFRGVTFSRNETSASKKS